ncbi:girdin-like [Belonocnema kinseyi]|uniref:girdin-like n=1 Tax=Belonocnema kinseyi TaxID=2817044 RepID=UPI00143DA56B|nr:girdin-like [Belonocnema kinseyi]
MASLKVEEFLSGPLVTWFISCLNDPNSLATYSDLVDGVLLHSVYLQIDPEPFYNRITASNGIVNIRIKNLECILLNVKQFYEEHLGHLLLKSPDTTNLAKNPESHIEDMKLMLLLILGCAIHCPKKEKFITNIKTLHEKTQLAIVEYIKQITDYQEILISQESLENANLGGLFTQVQKLMKERNFYYEKSKNLELNENEILGNSTMLISYCEERNQSEINSTMKIDIEEDHHCPALSDWKAKFRKLRHELEEKSEALLECRGEVEHSTMLLSKLTQENQTLMMEARTAKSYRDELDAAIEKAQKVDRLEVEISRYREKLSDIEFYKTRIEELREDNKVLLETRETLEEELNSQMKRTEKIPELEAESLELKRLLNNMTLERIADKEKYEQLREENIHLQCFIKSKHETSVRQSLNDSSEESEILNSSLSEQLKSSAQTYTLKLELENRRLLSELESIKQNSIQKDSLRILELENGKKELQLKLDSFVKNNERLSNKSSNFEATSRIGELEKEKKELKLKVDSLTKNNERLTQRNSNLDYTCKVMKQEKQNLQVAFAKQQAEIEDQIILESHHEQLSNDYVKRLQERDHLKANLEDCEKELKSLNDSYRRLQNINKSLLNEREVREKDIKILQNFKREYKKLQDDFKNMFTRADILRIKNKKLEKTNMDNYKKLTEMLKEVCAKEARCSNLELQVENLNQRCQELHDFNSVLEDEKRKLMDRLTDLVNQNRDLFTHTLEDKEYFYKEERKFKERIHHMSTTNVQLEQKIMDFYKTLPANIAPPTHNKKISSFGSTLVRKVKKAGSEILGLNRRSSSSWADDFKRADERPSEFDLGFGENDFESNKNMTLDPRLLRGKRPLRDRLSLGILGRGKLSYCSEDSVIPTLATALDKSFSGTFNYFKDENKPTDAESKPSIDQFNSSVFEVIPEIEDGISLKSDKQDKNENPNETEEEKDLDNYYKKPTRAGSKSSLWLEYGCA